MIPILYSSTEKDYTHNGIAPLKESIEAKVTEEANGLLELYLEYPVNGMWAKEITDQRLIKAKPNDLDEPHVFRIYEIVKNMEDQLLYIYASSITNDLGLDLVKSATVSGATGQQAMNAIKANLTQGTTLTLGSDIATRSSTKWSMRNPLNCIVGEEGSIVQWWGGELKRNNEGLYLYARRGRNDVTVIRQGKNLEGFDMTVSTQGLITRILPHATIRNAETGEESEIIGSVVNSPRMNNYPVRRIVAVDYTDESITTLAQLNSAASTYFTTRNPDSDKPKVRFNIDMLQLSNTSYYAKFKKLESVGVFDTVTVYVPKFDVNVNVKIRSVEYDVLREKTVRIVAGDAVSDIFKDIRNDYTHIINDTTATLQTIIQQAANGNNKIWRTTSTPVGPHKKGDLWYKPVGEHMVLLQWDGLTWEEILNTEDLESIKREVDAAIAEAEEAKQAAEQSYTDSVAEAERLVQVQTDAFNAQMSDVSDEFNTVKANIDTAISNVNQEIADSFTSLSDSISEVDDLAAQAKADADQALLDLKSKASTAALEAYNAATEAELALKATAKALEDGLALKVAVATYNAKVTELNSLISTAQSKADKAAADLLKKADATVVNAELAKKLATSTYNAKMTTLDTAISGHTTRIEATEKGLLAKASTTDVNALKTRMSNAETSLTTNADAIALKASQEDLDAVEGRLETTEADLVVQAGEIASKVAKTDFNKLTGRVGTAESTITQHASEIASRVKQTDFDSLTGRVETAESTITQQAGLIESKVAKTTYDTDINNATTGLKKKMSNAESRITQTEKDITSKVSQTTYDTDINNATTGLKKRISTAESTITQQAGLIASKVATTTYTTGLATKANASDVYKKSEVDTKVNAKADASTVTALTTRVTNSESKITQTEKDIALRATKTEAQGYAQTAVDGIEVGGRNHLRNTGVERSESISMFGAEMAAAEGRVSLNAGAEYYTLESTSASGEVRYRARIQGTLPSELSGTWAFSGEVLIPEGTSGVPHTRTQIAINSPDRWTNSYGNGERPINATKGIWIKFAHIFEMPEGTQSLHLGIKFADKTQEVGDKIHFKNFKLERGNKATDWTPAPEDVDASITAVQSDLTVEAGKITALTTRVTGTETNITKVTQTVSGHTSTISTLRTDVNGKATIVSLNAVKSTADGNKTTISNHAGRLTTVETNINGLQATVADKADKSQITQLNTSISTKVESSTYNSKMTQLDNAINLRVVQGDVTAAILADKKIKDTRTTNQLPSWYYTNYTSQRVEEFKQRATIGVPGSSTYAKLVTDVPWSSSSGGVVVQTAYSSDGVFNRSGNSAGTAWGSWVKQIDSANVLAQINLSSEGVLIQGKRIQLDGDVTMTAAYVTKLDTQTLSAITANITSIRSKVLVTDSVTSTHIKAENALIDGIFGTTALITRLTSKTAFVDNVKAIEISADKITTGTLNAANVDIINLNVSKLVGETSNFVQSNWNSATGGNVQATGDGLTARNTTNSFYTRLTSGLIYFGDDLNTTVGSMGSMVREGSNTIRGVGIYVENNKEFGVAKRWSASGAYEYILRSAINSRGLDIFAPLSVRATMNMHGNQIHNADRIYFGDTTEGIMRYPTDGTLVMFGSEGVRLGNGNATNYTTSVHIGSRTTAIHNNLTVNSDATFNAPLNMGTNQITNVSSVIMRGGTTALTNSSTNIAVVTGSAGVYLSYGTASSWSQRLFVGDSVVRMFRNLDMNSYTITGQSDRRLKTDITPTSTVALDGYRQLNIVDFSWKDPSKPSGRHLGVIAQDTPFWSMYDAETDTWMINSGKQIMYNSLGIKELTTIIDKHTSDILRIDTFVGQHEQEIKQLKQKIAELERKIA